MLVKDIRGHSSQADTVEEILERVKKMLVESKLKIEFGEYHDSVKLEGQEIRTGKNTIVIKCDEGDPDVEITVFTRCCGR